MWAERLSPYDFEVIHGPGGTLNIADYFSRNPTHLNESSMNAKKTMGGVVHNKCCFRNEEQRAGKSESDPRRPATNHKRKQRNGRRKWER